MADDIDHRIERCKRIERPAPLDAGIGAAEEGVGAETEVAANLLAERTALAAMMLTDPTLEQRPAIWQQASALFRQGLAELGSADLFQGLIASQIVAMNGALMTCIARAHRAGDRSRARKAELRLALLLLRTLIQHTRALDKSTRGRPQRRERAVRPLDALAASEVV
jgi:hypothetical protein